MSSSSEEPTLAGIYTNPAPRLLTSFTTLDGATVTSPVITLPTSARCVRVTWQVITGGGISPTEIIVSSPDGSIVWEDLKIGFIPNTNLRSYDVIVPVLVSITPDVVVTVSEAGGNTHKVFVSSMADSAFTSTIIAGSVAVQAVSIAQVTTQPALTSFGELAVGGFGGGFNPSAVSAANTALTVTLPATTGFAWHVMSITASYSAAPTAPKMVTATDIFETTWRAFVPGGPSPVLHATFPDGGIRFLNTAAVTFTLPAGGSGIIGALSVIADNRLY